MSVRQVEVTDPNKTTLEDGVEVLFNEDGAVVDFAPEPEQKERDNRWFKNLAEDMDYTEAVGLAQRMIDLIEEDIENRSEWQELAEKGMEHLGVKPMRTANSEITGASEMNMPLISDIAQNFTARASEELFPADGPAKAKIIGDETEERVAQGERVIDFMNFHLTEVDKKYYPDSEDLLFKASLWGSMFRFTEIDRRTNRPTQRIIDPFDFILPYRSGGIHNTPRYAIRDTMYKQHIEADQASGYYAPDFPLMSTRENLEVDLRDESDKQYAPNDQDELHEMLIVFIEEDMSQYDPMCEGVCPYMLVIDRTSRVVLRMERDWEMDDELKQRIERVSHWRYLPGLGVYGFGLIHFIGALGLAATEAMRAMFDAATLASFPGGFKRKGVGVSGDLHMTRGVWKEIEFDADEDVALENAFLKLPVDQPSPALYQAFKEIVDTGRRFGSVTEMLVGEGAQTGPVGTTLAKIEQALKVMSGIHKRMHNALRSDLRILHRFLRDAAPDEGYPYMQDGEPTQIMHADFDDRIDVIPVSDPNIFSSVQRIAMAQAVVELTASAPDLYGEKERRAAHRMLLLALKVPDVDVILPEDSGEPPHLDPVSENMKAMVGQPITVHPAQNHAAHMAVHQDFMARMLPTMPPEAQNVVGSALVAHMQEHMAYQYQQMMAQASGVQMLPLPINEMDEPMPADLDEELSVAAAQAIQQLPPPQPPEGEGDEQDDIDRKGERELAVRREAREQAQFEAEQSRKDAQAQQESMLNDLRAEQIKADIEHKRAQTAKLNREDRDDATSDEAGNS